MAITCAPTQITWGTGNLGPVYLLYLPPTTFPSITLSFWHHISCYLLNSSSFFCLSKSSDWLFPLPPDIGVPLLSFLFLLRFVSMVLPYCSDTHCVTLSSYIIYYFLNLCTLQFPQQNGNPIGSFACFAYPCLPNILRCVGTQQVLKINVEYKIMQIVF